MVADPKLSLLHQPYRDRQIIVVQRAAESDPAPVSVRLRDYYSVRTHIANLNPKNWLRKSHWSDSKNWGLYGYAYDRLRGKTSSPGKQKVDHFVRIGADAAERLFDFPAGHPRYDTAYVGHPLRAERYMPLATFHHRIFEDKFNELISLLSELGATKLSIGFSSDQKQKASAKASFNFVEELLASVRGSIETYSISSVEGNFDARFNPSEAPKIPNDLAWLEHEPTWLRVAKSRLNSGLTQIDVSLRYEDDFGIDASLAAGLESFGLNIGGEFSNFQRTVWTFKGTFSEMED